MRKLAIMAALVFTLPVGAQDSTSTACHVAPSGRASSGVGALVGVSMVCPSNTITLGYQFTAGGGSVDYVGRYRSFSLHLTAVSSEFQWYYGQGDATAFNDDSAFGQKYYRERQSYFAVNPAWTIPVAPHLTVTVGPELRYWDTGNVGGFIDSTRPYGLGPFGTVSGLLNAQFRTRRLDVDITGRGVPAAWDAHQAYGTLRGTVGTHVGVLFVRVGGQKDWGDAPFQDLTHIGAGAPGDPTTVRGYLPERFTGEASAFANVRVEVPVSRTTIVVPVTIGLLALNDVGRVFVPGDDASVWHDGIGGGVYIAPADRRRIVSASLVHGTEGTRFYLGYGAGF